MPATSLSQVCGFIATIMSTPPRAPRWPVFVTRTSYQVGRPWMLEGKMLRGLTGTPMAQDRAREHLVGAGRARAVDVGEADDEVVYAADRLFVGHARTCLSHLDEVFLHVPGSGGTALGAQAAMQADVLVLDHHAPGLQVAGDVEVLVRMRRGRLQALAQIGFLAILGEGDAVHRADVDAGVALDAERGREHGLDVAVQAALRLRRARA